MDPQSSVEIVSVLGNARGVLDAFRRLLLEYEESLDVDLRIPYLEAELAELDRRYAGGALFLARLASAGVGCVALKRLDDRSAEIKRLYVVPNARGTGTGRALLEACIAFSRDGGYRRVVLDTHRHRLKAAYDLYCRLGFRECEPYAAAEYACPTFMELQLAGE